MSSKINVLELLRQIDDYVLIKMDPEGFPIYSKGDDIDLIVFDPDEALRRVCAFFDSEVGESGELRVTNADGHIHADFFLMDLLEIRIDLIHDFTFFQKLNVRPVFVTKIFKDRQKRLVEGGGVWVPSAEDDLTLRYFEYLEWFAIRPDKIKHLEYLCRIQDESLRKRFFENTHRFIQFHPKTWQGEVPSRGTKRVFVFESRRDAARALSSASRYLVRATMRNWGNKLASVGGGRLCKRIKR
ncbi:MAG TPA: hypothetical protein PK251_06375 [Candidatus Latescibacteria bacterium]|nr:hypothetical protein [Candidatus Latescibacterota bacterium]HPK75271.1 hypothetical protein [Candidatus Latescibacterota bacterium]